LRTWIVYLSAKWSHLQYIVGMQF